ncbi:hypothetical protein HZB07_00265 [Candidatus Saganbacteria bacterium]|nr:hypothetical protein [Candidatus Saganbacteria bacterium]
MGIYESALEVKRSVTRPLRRFWRQTVSPFSRSSGGLGMHWHNIVSPWASQLCKDYLGYDRAKLAVELSALLKAQIERPDNWFDPKHEKAWNWLAAEKRRMIFQTAAEYGLVDWSAAHRPGNSAEFHQYQLPLLVEKKDVDDFTEKVKGINDDLLKKTRAADDKDFLAERDPNSHMFGTLPDFPAVNTEPLLAAFTAGNGRVGELKTISNEITSLLLVFGAGALASASMQFLPPLFVVACATAALSLAAKLGSRKYWPGSFIETYDRLPPASIPGMIAKELRKNQVFAPLFALGLAGTAIYTGAYVKQRFYPPVIDENYYSGITIMPRAGKIFVTACHPPQPCSDTLIANWGPTRAAQAEASASRLGGAIDARDFHDRGVVSLGDRVFIVSSWAAYIPEAIRPDWEVFLDPLADGLSSEEASSLVSNIMASGTGLWPNYVDRARGIERRIAAQRTLWGHRVTEFRDLGYQTSLGLANTLTALGHYDEAVGELHRIEESPLSVTSRRPQFATEAYNDEANIYAQRALLRNEPIWLQRAMTASRISQDRLMSGEVGYRVTIATTELGICSYAAMVFPSCIRPPVSGWRNTVPCPPELINLCSPRDVHSYLNQALYPYFPLYVDNFLALRSLLSAADYYFSLPDFDNADRMLHHVENIIGIINNRYPAWGGLETRQPFAAQPFAPGIDQWISLHFGDDAASLSFRVRDQFLRQTRWDFGIFILNSQIDPRMFTYFNARRHLSSAYGHQLRAATAPPNGQIIEMETALREINAAIADLDEIRQRDESAFWSSRDEERNYYLETLVRKGEIELALYLSGNFTNIDFANTIRRTEEAALHLVIPPHTPNLTMLRAWLMLAKSHIALHDNAAARNYLERTLSATRGRISPLLQTMHTEAQGWLDYIADRPDGTLPPPQPLPQAPRPPIVLSEIPAGLWGIN